MWDFSEKGGNGLEICDICKDSEAQAKLKLGICEICQSLEARTSYKSKLGICETCGISVRRGNGLGICEICKDSWAQPKLKLGTCEICTNAKDM